MEISEKYRQPLECSACADSVGLDFDFTMAFQPIVNTKKKEIFAYEALARGLKNEPAGTIFDQVNKDNRYRFDQCCRTKAIKLAADLSMSTLLSINFMPNAVYQPESCIRTTLNAADAYGFPIEKIIFEITESEKVDDLEHLKKIVAYYRERGFKTAIDDFGAGYAGLNFLSEIRTDIIKLDMALIRNIDRDSVKQAIIRGVLQVCQELKTIVIAEGVETQAELKILQSFGIELFQGYLFAKPLFQQLVSPTKIDFSSLCSGK
ncbi:diguanylate phosphodiesterase [[Leptolyngbya] sp. PCC 7376]|uniref:EAL domain-containing protein n=1 Tax=[Leptolyngbya] sp. PCC 7376 TaxID=111781 RepID=UPI00029F0480|nr:EAL domain-containing protein [[Leptolyngbya] sp. PCC 7376]AFY38811.1 diguanylate phosphodiesterase [[Leptolyngbya] sp. PCC 7376]